MRKNNKVDAFHVYRNPTWILYECAMGARWAAVKWGMCEHNLSEDCDFSGHTPGHKVAIRGETQDRSVAHGWFTRGGDKQ